jgi:hypothetical protein
MAQAVAQADEEAAFVGVPEVAVVEFAVPVFAGEAGSDIGG